MQRRNCWRANRIATGNRRQQHTHSIMSNSSEDWRQQPPYALEQGASHRPAKWQGSCFCGGVKFEAFDDPKDNKVCHCVQCQRMHGAPMQSAAIFKKGDILFKEEALDNLRFYAAEDRKQERILPCKLYCRHCGSPIADEGRNMLMMFPSLFAFKRPHLPDAFKPTCHIFYGQRILDIHDGAPKFEGHKDKSAVLAES